MINGGIDINGYDSRKLKALPDNPDKSVAVAGKDTLLYVNTGTESAPVWTIVGGQRNAPVKMTANSLDASHKTSGGWASNVPGLKSWSIDYSGLMLMGDDGLQVLEYAFRNDKQVNVKIEYPNNLSRPDGRILQNSTTITRMMPLQQFL